MSDSLVAFAAGALLAYLWGRGQRKLGAWLEGVRARRAAAVARERSLQRNEAAEKLLATRGYKVIARDAPAAYAITVDGEPRVVHVAADFLVEHQGKRAIAEVKAGPAAKLDTPATRWQFLEHQHAFGVPAVLLVDPDQGTLATVRFPLAQTALTAVPPPLPVKREASQRLQRERKLTARTVRRRRLLKLALGSALVGAAWWMLRDPGPPPDHDAEPSEARLRSED